MSRRPVSPPFVPVVRHPLSVKECVSIIGSTFLVMSAISSGLTLLVLLVERRRKRQKEKLQRRQSIFAIHYDDHIEQIQSQYDHESREKSQAYQSLIDQKWNYQANSGNDEIQGKENRIKQYVLMSEHSPLNERRNIRLLLHTFTENPDVFITDKHRNHLSAFMNLFTPLPKDMINIILEMLQDTKLLNITVRPLTWGAQPRTTFVHNTIARIETLDIIYEISQIPFSIGAQIRDLANTYSDSDLVIGSEFLDPIAKDGSQDLYLQRWMALLQKYLEKHKGKTSRCVYCSLNKLC